MEHYNSVNSILSVIALQKLEFTLEARQVKGLKDAYIFIRNSLHGKFQLIEILKKKAGGTASCNRLG